MRENVREPDREEALVQDLRERDHLRQSRVEKVIDALWQFNLISAPIPISELYHRRLVDDALTKRFPVYNCPRIHLKIELDCID